MDADRDHWSVPLSRILSGLRQASRLFFACASLLVLYWYYYYRPGPGPDLGTGPGPKISAPRTGLVIIKTVAGEAIPSKHDRPPKLEGNCRVIVVSKIIHSNLRPLSYRYSLAYEPEYLSDTSPKASDVPYARHAASTANVYGRICVHDAALHMCYTELDDWTLTMGEQKSVTR